MNVWPAAYEASGEHRKSTIPSVEIDKDACNRWAVCIFQEASSNKRSLGNSREKVLPWATDNLGAPLYFGHSCRARARSLSSKWNTIFSINYDLNAVLYDERLSCELERAFDEDLEHCSVFDLAEYRARNPVVRFRDSVARLFSPLL